jgi:hypothetical protein
VNFINLFGIKIKHSPFYKEYKTALNLAKLIFKRLGFSLNANADILKTPPYYINMPKLFERYVELQLIKSKIPYIDGNEQNIANFGMKPDFILPNLNTILDAKYKFWYKQDHETAEFKEDYLQISLYGRDKDIREKLNSNTEPLLMLVYPHLEKNTCKKSQKFFQIYLCGLKVPLKEENEHTR